MVRTTVGAAGGLHVVLVAVIAIVVTLGRRLPLHVGRPFEEVAAIRVVDFVTWPFPFALVPTWAYRSESGNKYAYTVLTVSLSMENGCG